MAWLADGEEKNFEDIFIRFDRMYERDGRTDGHRITAKAALDAGIARQKYKTNTIIYRARLTKTNNVKTRNI